MKNFEAMATVEAGLPEVSRAEKVPKIEQRKNPTEKLRELLSDIAKHINSEVSEKYGMEHLVNDDCSISMPEYGRKNEKQPDYGIYEKGQIEKDVAVVTAREMEFSGANKPAVQKHFLSVEGIGTPEGIVDYWKKNKLKQKSAQTEMVVTALLHKILKDRFLVVRASPYDDYMHGVDNLILNKETGEVVCAFDEVHDAEVTGNTSRKETKEDKIKKIALNGGVKARYGISLDQGDLKRAHMDHVPVFYLSLKTEQLLTLLGGMNYDVSQNNSPIEYTVFNSLVKSLREQKTRLLSLPQLSPVLKNKLEKFEDTLKTLETFSEDKGSGTLN